MKNICTHKTLNMDVHSWTIHSCPKVEQSKCSSTGEYINKSHNQKKVLRRQKWSTDTSYAMDRRWKHQTMWKKMAVKGHIMNDPISWHPEQANSQNQKIYQCLPKAGERLIMGTLGWCSEIGNGDGCTLSEVTLVQYKPTGLHNWKRVDFMVYTGFCLSEAVLKQQQQQEANKKPNQTTSLTK